VQPATPDFRRTRRTRLSLIAPIMTLVIFGNWRGSLAGSIVTGEVEGIYPERPRQPLKSSEADNNLEGTQAARLLRV
jgi:hypothetical protein